MDGQFDGERESQLRVRVQGARPELDSAGHRAHELRELRNWYPHDDIEQGMWLPRSPEPLANRTLPGDLADFFAQLKRRVRRMLRTPTEPSPPAGRPPDA